MKINKKIFIILLFAICIVSLLFGSVAYYRFLVSGNINGSTGNAVFNVTGFKDDSSSIKTIELGKVSPGDSGEFTITLDASGSTVDMYATLSIDRGSGDTELPTNLKFYTTPDHKSELHKYYSFLETTGTQKEELTIYWYWNPFISDEEDNKYINREFSANIKVSAVQISEYAMMKNGYSTVTSTNGGSEFWNNTYKPYIRTIMFGNDLSNKPESCTGNSDLCWDVSYDTNQNKKVYAYLVDSGLKDTSDSTKALYNLYIVSEAPIFAPRECNYMFSGFTNLMKINFNDNFNTSKTIEMKAMFYNNIFLDELDVNCFNTSNVTTMRFIFQKCLALQKIYFSNFNTSKVTDMGYMFSKLNIDSIALNNINTSNATNMTGMFWDSKIVNMNLNSFNTSNVTDMYCMFKDCTKLQELDLRNFNTSNVTNMNSMFYNCSSLTDLDLSNFNTSRLTKVGNMFYNCTKLRQLDLTNWNTSNIPSFADDYINYGMFRNCENIQLKINIMNSNMNLDSVKYIFLDALTNQDAYVIIGYTNDATKAIAEAMKATAATTYQSKITLKPI